MQSDDASEIPYIQPPGPARLAFSVWIAITIVSTLIAAVAIDPAMVGISNLGWLMTSVSMAGR